MEEGLLGFGALLKAASALEPHSLIDVRYSSLTTQLWVQFSDGLFGLVLWGELGLQDQVRSLMLQTATLRKQRDNGGDPERWRRRLLHRCPFPQTCPCSLLSTRGVHGGGAEHIRSRMSPARQHARVVRWKPGASLQATASRGESGLLAC